MLLIVDDDAQVSTYLFHGKMSYDRPTGASGLAGTFPFNIMADTSLDVKSIGDMVPFAKTKPSSNNSRKAPEQGGNNAQFDGGIGAQHHQTLCWPEGLHRGSRDEQTAQFFV
jgi:hypothetical protein